MGLVLGFGLSQLGSAAGWGATAIAPAIEESTAAQELPQSVPQGIFVDVAEQVGPAVVFIQAEHSVSLEEFHRGIPFEDFFRFFGEAPPEDPEDVPDERTQRSQGSGFLVDTGGYILTNAHVVSRVNPDPEEVETIRAQRITVRLANEEEYDAEIVGLDIGTDIAVLQIDADADLPSVPLGDSDSTQVGEWVMALGAPFGLTNTVSAGIISAKGRALLGLQARGTHYQDFLQTDAAINPGNSGGPLVNLQGEVVGINTAIAATNEYQPQFSGVGFAAPINLVKTVMSQLIEHGRVVRGWLGVSVSPLDRNLAEGLGVDDIRWRGAVYLAGIDEGEPADLAGLQQYDVITHMNGVRLEGSQDFVQRVGLVPPGETISLTAIRDGEQVDVDVTLAERPSEEEIYRRRIADNRGPAIEPRAPPARSTTASGKLGVSVTELTPRLAEQLGFEGDEGIVVTRVRPNSPADRAGVVPRDIILEAGRQPVSSIQDFEEILEQAEPGHVVLLRVRRPNGNTGLLAPRVPEE